MIKLTKAQQKIIYIGGTAVILLICLWIFIYLPQVKKSEELKKQFEGVQTQISEITDLVKGKDLADAIMDLNKQIKSITARISLGEEDIIHSLSEEARRLNIEIKNITSSGRRPLDYQITDYTIQELLISMSLVCEFRKLGDYLDRLEHGSPFLFRVRQVNIRGKGEGQPNLDVTLQISAYLSKRK